MKFEIFKNSQYKLLLALFSSWGLYFVVFWLKMLYYNQEGDLVAGWRNIWGDWAMHLSQTSAFAYQPILRVLENHPVYSGASLSYPFVTNLISGLLVRLGFNLVQATILPSLLFSFALLYSLAILGRTLVKSASQIYVAITIFLTSGGLGFFYLFSDLKQSFSLETLLHSPHEYTHMKDIGYYWTTTLLAHLVPQRAFLLGMVIASLILAFLFHNFKKNFSQIKVKQMLVLGILTGSLAFIHSHSLMVLFFISAWLFLFSLKKYQYWFSFAIGTAITALPFFLLFPGPKFANYLWFLPGWLANARELNMPVVWFWLSNWGLLIPAAIIGTLLTIKERALRIFILGFSLIFLICNFVVFQPSSWDNAKLLLWVYLIFSFPAAGLVVWLWQEMTISKILASLLFFILIASGGLDLIRVLKTSRESFVMVPREEIVMAQQFRELTNPDSLVLTSDNHLHWVPVLAGRSIVLGYRGWLWSHGFDYSQKEIDIKKIYQGDPQAWQLIKDYGIDYIVTDEKTKQDYNSNDQFLENNFDLFVVSPRFKVYKTY